MSKPRIVVAAVVAALVAGGCSQKKHQIVKVDGSSTVLPISEAVAESFFEANLGDVTVGGSGTGAGFKKFCRGEIHISGASRPIKKEEAEACAKAGIDFIELPVAYDGLAVVVHPANDWVDHLTVEELKRMWEPAASQTITRWAHVREGFPDVPLHLYGPGTESGTYDYFTGAITGKERSSRGDFTSNEDDNVLVQGVSGDKSALGFFGYAYYIEHKDRLKLVPIDDGKPDNGAGPIAPTLETVADGTYSPLSRPVYIYVSTRALERPTVQRFVEFYLANAPTLTGEVGYIPLPPRAYALVTHRFEERKLGTVGAKVGMTIEQLLEREER